MFREFKRRKKLKKKREWFDKVFWTEFQIFKKEDKFGQTKTTRTKIKNKVSNLISWGVKDNPRKTIQGIINRETT